MLNFARVHENSMWWQHVHTYRGCSDNEMRKSTELHKTGFLTCLGTTGFSSVHETKVLWQSMQMCLLLSVSSSAEGMHLATTNESKFTHQSNTPELTFWGHCDNKLNNCTLHILLNHGMLYRHDYPGVPFVEEIYLLSAWQIHQDCTQLYSSAESANYKQNMGKLMSL